MNADFNVGFMQEQLTAEQMFNRASLAEFEGGTGGEYVDMALDGLERAAEGLSSAIEKNEQLIEMVQNTELNPDFESALEKYIGELNVNSLPRIGEDDRDVQTLEDILHVLQSEFATLLDLTEGTIEATREIRGTADEGLFVATVLESNTPFNAVKIALGFGRGEVSTFMSTACHATILAIEERFPEGFEFLTEGVSSE